MTPHIKIVKGAARELPPWMCPYLVDQGAPPE
jgi:hypothetical protein